MKHTSMMSKTILLLAMLALMLTAVPQLALAEDFAAIVTSSWMPVYSDSRLTNDAGTIAGGEIVSVTAYQNGVAAIVYKGERGYARISDMAKVSAYGKRAVVSADNARVYETASADARSMAMKKGLEVYVVENFGEWAKIVRGTLAGYADADALTLLDAPDATPEPTPTPVALTPTTNIPATVTADSVTVYASADTGSKVLGIMPKGATMNVVDYNAKWAFVEKNGRYGFCDIAALTKTSELIPQVTPAPTAPQSAVIPATVTADSVKVYESRSTDSKVLGTMKKGATMNVVDYDSTWAHVEKDGRYGYCDIRALTKTADLQPTATPYAQQAISAEVSADSVKVYDIPSTSGACLGAMKKGTKVTVLDYTSTWAHVELKGKYGYCDIKALKKTEDAQPTNAPVKFTAVVIYPNMPVYAKKSTESAYTTLRAAATVNVYAYDSTWAYISNGDVKGYALVKYMTREEYPELVAGSTGDAVLKLQKALEALGYFDGVPGGNFSTQTKEAVYRFANALNDSYDQQFADSGLQAVLYGGYAPACSLLSANLAKGDTGAQVTRLQTRLYNKGYLSKTGSVDGDYGATTEAAVKLFQKKAGMTETGKADKTTIRALYRNDAPALGNGTPADANAPGGDGDKTAPIDAGDKPGGNSKIETVITAAKNQLGKPYVYGATGMSSFDCSGLTQYAFRQAGYNLNRTAYAQGYNDGVKITGLSNLVRGDLVCMNTIADSDLCDHVGIYLGGGQMIHASSGSHKVVISSLTSGYYNRVFSWGRRIIQ